MRIGALGAALLVGLVGCAAEPPPHVVLVLIDTLRADHLGFAGYPRPTSPNLDALAAGSWVFDRHVASASQTVPSTLSMMLSVDPAEHGFSHERNGQFLEAPPRYPEEFVFLAEVFAAAGYATAAFVGNPFLQTQNGFGQGFERLEYSEGRGEELTDRALAWLDEEASGARPLFLYLHYFDVHWPYDPPEPFRSRFWRGRPGRLAYTNGPAPRITPDEIRFTQAMYDAEIAYVDHQVARLLDAFASRGLREKTLFVVTSDHGDEFLEHGGLGHGTTVYGELVRVPLILSYPAKLAAPRRISHLSRHLDLAPTLLSLAGLAAPSAFRGTTLLEPAPFAISENGPWRSVYASEGKVVVNRETGMRESFRSDDPRDQHPLERPPDPDLLARLDAYEQMRAARRGQSRPPDAPAWSDAEAERLRELGYAH